ncbi:MAG: hypothetical protein SFY66_06935 [Oculatellaceae cyanobacterium bins.114]|nr:hypothetical protein [Oculatellaceae cyanobacterium bins.114]
MSASNPSFELTLHRLRQVRTTLLRLHKALLNSERLVYEQFHGRIQSNGEFFRLVVGHEWFDWLRPMSQLIVQMDDLLHTKEPITVDQVNGVLEQAQSLLQPDVDGTPSEKRYYRAIQRDPDIALMHAEISRLL